MRKALIFIWLTLCSAVLALTLYAYDARLGADMGSLFLWLMIGLTFPTGIVVASTAALIVSALGERWSGDVPAATYFLLMWSVFVVFGYLQWFWFLPWVRQKLAGSGQHRKENG